MKKSISKNEIYKLAKTMKRKDEYLYLNSYKKEDFKKSLLENKEIITNISMESNQLNILPDFKFSGSRTKEAYEVSQIRSILWKAYYNF